MRSLSASTTISWNDDGHLIVGMHMYFACIYKSSNLLDSITLNGTMVDHAKKLFALNGLNIHRHCKMIHHMISPTT